MTSIINPTSQKVCSNSSLGWRCFNYYKVVWLRWNVPMIFQIIVLWGVFCQPLRASLFTVKPRLVLLEYLMWGFTLSRRSDSKPSFETVIFTRCSTHNWRISSAYLNEPQVVVTSGCKCSCRHPLCYFNSQYLHPRTVFVSSFLSQSDSANHPHISLP